MPGFKITLELAQSTKMHNLWRFTTKLYAKNRAYEINEAVKNII